MTFAQTLPKPLYGEPCNGCGGCCLAVQCPLSTAIFGYLHAACPAIERDGAKLTCGLVRNTADYVPDLPSWGSEALSEAFGIMLGAGIGCDGSAGPEDIDRHETFRPVMVAKAKASIASASPEARELISYFQGVTP